MPERLEKRRQRARKVFGKESVIGLRASLRTVRSITN